MPKIMHTVVIKTDAKFTAKSILHLICYSSSDVIKMIAKLKANITPMITKRVEKTPKIPFLVSYLGANSPI